MYSLFVSLLLYAVPLDVGKTAIADATKIVGPVPEVRLPIEAGNMICKLISGFPGTCGLDVVNQSGDIQRRVNLNQKMNVIVLATVFDQAAAP